MDRRQPIQDEITVLRAQQSAEHFDALVARWQRPLWTHAHRLTGDREAAWDIVQEAWMTVLRKIGELRSPGAFPAWAYRIVTNKCRNWRRKHGRRQELLAEYADRAERERTSTLAPRGRHDGLDAAFSSLSLERRMLLSLYYDEEFPVREIADIFGLSEGTVKSRLYRARQELRTRMEELTDER